MMINPILKNFNTGNESHGLVIYGNENLLQVGPGALTSMSYLANEYYNHLAQRGEILPIVFAGLHADSRSGDHSRDGLNRLLGCFAL